MIYADINHEESGYSAEIIADRKFLEGLIKEFFEKDNLLVPADGSAIRVIDENGRYLFSLKRDMPFLPINEWRVFGIPFDDGLNSVNLEYMDVSIFNGYNRIVFCELDTYSLFLSKVISSKCQNLNIFWDNAVISVIKSLYSDSQFCELDRSKVNSDRTLIISRDKTKECNVIDTHYVIQYVIAGYRRRKYGNTNKDKTILMVDFQVGPNGMGDAVKIANGLTGLALKKGWVPVINMYGDNQYLDSPHDNMWDYYFEQPGGISVDEALQSSSVISSEENLLGMNEFLASPYMDRLIDGEYGRLSFSKKMEECFRQSIACEKIRSVRSRGQKVLGVILRGSDMSMGKRSGFHISSMVERVRLLNEEKHYGAFFLASEDELYFSGFSDGFKDQEIIYIDQKRVKRDYDNDTYVMVAELPEMERGRAWGEKYLEITYCLSLCDEIAYSMSAGTRWLAGKWKNIRGESFSEEYNISEFEDVRSNGYLQELFDYIDDHDHVILYGTGQMCERLYLPLQGKSKKLYYCDRRAENEEFYYHGRKVNSPGEIMDLCKSSRTGIIITPFSGISDIETGLHDMGIEGDILILRDLIGKYR